MLCGNSGEPEASRFHALNRSEGGKMLHDTVVWQEHTAGLKPGITSQHAHSYWFVAVLDLNLHKPFEH